MNKQLEPRYVVIKKKDLADALSSGLITESDVGTLDKVSQAVDSIRQQRGKASFECAVVESDWPIYQEVVDKLAAPKPRFFGWAKNLKSTVAHLSTQSEIAD